MEATHEGVVVGVNSQLGERKCSFPFLLDPFPVEAGDGKWFAGDRATPLRGPHARRKASRGLFLDAFANTRPGPLAKAHSITDASGDCRASTS